MPPGCSTPRLAGLSDAKPACRVGLADAAPVLKAVPVRAGAVGASVCTAADCTRPADDAWWWLGGPTLPVPPPWLAGERVLTWAAGATVVSALSRPSWCIVKSLSASSRMRSACSYAISLQ